MKSSPAEISLPTSPTGSSLPTSPTGSSLPTTPKESSLPKNLIPELTVLGLRLTVGEDQVKTGNKTKVKNGKRWKYEAKRDCRRNFKWHKVTNQFF